MISGDKPDEKIQRVHYVSADKYILNYIEETCNSTNVVFYFGQSEVHQSPSTSSGIYAATAWNSKANILVFCFCASCIYWISKSRNSWGKWQHPDNIVYVDNPIP